MSSKDAGSSSGTKVGGKGYMSGLLGNTGDVTLATLDEVVGVAAVLRSRYNVVFMAHGEGDKKRTFVKFTINGDKQDKEKGTRVAVYVQMPNERFKHVRFMAYAMNNKTKRSAAFRSLTVQQFLELLNLLHSSYSVIHRVFAVTDAPVAEAQEPVPDAGEFPEFDDDIPF